MKIIPVQEITYNVYQYCTSIDRAYVAFGRFRIIQLSWYERNII